MEKPFVFVLMPFATEFDDIYKLGIKVATDEVGMYCERVDEQIFEERILDRIYNQINKADYIISDLSGKNPNVFYETGYAHALNKKVLMIVSEEKDIPFDLKHHPLIIYNKSISYLQDELSRRLLWYSSHPEQSNLPNYDSLKYFIGGQLVEHGASIVVYQDYSDQNRFLLFVKVDVHNDSDTVFRDYFEIGLQVPAEMLKVVGDGIVKPSIEWNIATASKGFQKVMPHGWVSTIFEFTEEIHGIRVMGTDIPVMLKVFSDLKLHEIAFTLHVSGKAFGRF